MQPRAWILSAATLLAALAFVLSASAATASIVAPMTGHLNSVSCPASNACTAVGFYGQYPVFPVAEQWDGPQWTYEPISNQIDGQLTTVSCSSATACMAVGVYGFGQNKGATFAAQWNGSGWTVLAMPHFSDYVINSISCSSRSACTTVGELYVGKSRRQEALAERWNGSSWKVQTTPLVSKRANLLDGVSCWAADACTAVGLYTPKSRNLAFTEHWNGRRWRVESIHGPAGSRHSSLDAVSCRGPRSCTAVGSYGGSSRNVVAFAERWNGRRWGAERLPRPAGSKTTTLGSVSCATSKSCLAIGVRVAGSEHSILAEQWNGKRWSIRSITQSAGVSGLESSAVACSGAADCVATINGTVSTPEPVPVSAIERWNGHSWSSEQPEAEPALPTPALNGISCLSTTWCMAVGQNSDDPLAELWNGAAWTVVPTAGSDLSLGSVSCTSAAACMAVGSADVNDDFEPQAEQWNGSAWTLVPTPTGLGGLAKPAAVSCTAADACTMVGQLSLTGGSATPLVERWNGIAWSVESAPTPSGAPGAQLNGVACTGPTSCTAVGYSYTSAPDLGAVALTEQWNGSSWTIEPDPAFPSGWITSLGAVSCSATDACEAVGTGGTANDATLAERWNGTSWALQSIPNPAGTASFPAVGAVSCNPDGSCTAIGTVLGNNGPDGSTVPNSDEWNGSGWTLFQVQAPPSSSLIPGSAVYPLTAVSCTAADWCMAAGQVDYLDDSSAALAEQWNGSSWTITPTPPA